MPEELKITIITINFNNECGLNKTVESVINQTYGNVEYIIIDGGSTDGSLKVIESHKAKINYWISEKDNGIYHAMNKGILKASGDFLMFLNSGDNLSDPYVIQRCNDLILDPTNADIYYGDMFIVNHMDNPKKVHCTHPNQLSLNFFKESTINHQAALINAYLFKEFGLYPEHYKLASDYWLFLNCLFHNKKFKHINIPMVEYDFRGISSLNKEMYDSEKQLIWNNLIPDCVQSVISENEYYKKLTGYRIVKKAIQLNNQFQIFRSRKFIS